MSARRIEDAAEFEVWIGGTGALVLFTAPWCSPGERLARLLDAIAPDLAVAVAVVDVDRHPALPRRYGIAGLPSLVLFRAGLVVGMRFGELDRAAIEDWLDATLPLPPAPDDAASRQGPACPAGGSPCSQAP
jgi:thioredoxin 1